MFFDNIKILPLLVFVVMLAFSVRLAQVVTGITSLTTASYASEAKPADKKEEKKEEKKEGGHGEKGESKGSETIPLPPPIEGSMDKDKKGALEFPDAKAADAKKAGKPIGWKDASESDVEYSKVKKDLSDDLAGRREELDKREKALQTKEALLTAGERELDRKLTELTQLRGEIEKLLKTQADEENGRIASLVKVYEGMKPADAARIFNTLDIDVLVSVMSKMSERKLSPVLAAMDPERAKTITIMLAQEKQLPELPPSN